MPKEVELAPALNDGFDQPQVVSDVQFVFSANVSDLMPPFEAIPDEFKGGNNEWNVFVREWGFGGWPSRGLYSREDVDSEKAFRHLQTILSSFEPKYEHKEAAVSWLASRWFAAVVEKKDES